MRHHRFPIRKVDVREGLKHDVRRFRVEGDVELGGRRDVAALEEAATSWWSDSLVLVLTLNRGILTARMGGQPLENAQLRLVSALFAKLAARLQVVARLVG